jgi:uncharacterized membrane protein
MNQPPAVPTGHSQGPAKARRGVKLGLAALMVVLAAVTLGAMIALWPSADETPQKRPYLDPGATSAPGVVTRLEPTPDGGQVTFRLDSNGEEVQLLTVGEVPLEDFEVGDHIKTVCFPDAGSDSGVVYVFQDFYRTWPMIALAVVFLLAVVGVARLKGLAAVVGLVGAVAVVWVFLLPALSAGRDPLLTVLTTASAVMFIVVYLAHGVSVKSTTALLGTLLGTAVVTTLAWWAVPSTHLIPMSDETLVRLSFEVPTVDLKGVLLCGMVLAGVGVLNDVTITQASAVWELRAAAPEASRRRVFASAMRIGRDHIASTVYTIAFAYIGGALGLLVVAANIDHTLANLLTTETVASEMVPILVASIGLVLAIPLTTAIGVWLGPSGTPPTPTRTMPSPQPPLPPPAPLASPVPALPAGSDGAGGALGAGDPTGPAAAAGAPGPVDARPGPSAGGGHPGSGAAGDSPPPPRRLDFVKGAGEIGAAFFEPLSPSELAAWEGE